MMSQNKILTVSYGTFSCTLEGFEDSFGTMKAIAEYFRDLASDDRYFGAEPPQPDAEMLARIAQKEISRRVEARQSDGRIVLSALEGGTVTPPETAPAQPQSQPASSAPVAAAAATAPHVAPAPAASPTASDVQPEAAPAPAEAEAPAAPQEIASEDITKEAPVAAPEAAAPPQDEEIGAPLYIAPEAQAPAPATEAATPQEAPAAQDSAMEDTAAADDAREADAETPDIVPGQPDEAVEAFFAESAETDADDYDEDQDTASGTAGSAAVEDVAEAEEIPAPAAAAIDSIAAKLQRIRAVVARNEAADHSAYDEEPETAEAQDIPVASQPEVLNDGVDSSAQAGATVALAAQDDAAEEDVEDDIAALLDTLNAGLDDAEADAAMGDAAEDMAEDESDDEDTDDMAEDDAASLGLANLFDDEAAAAVAAAQDDADAEAPQIAVQQDATHDDAAQDDTQEMREAAPARVRVMKVKRADLDAALEAGTLVEYTAEGDDDIEISDTTSAQPARGLDDLAPAKSGTTSLTPEDQDELARELAALEADIEGGAPHGDTPDTEEELEAARAAVFEDLDEEQDGTDAETDYASDYDAVAGPAAGPDPISLDLSDYVTADAPEAEEDAEAAEQADDDAVAEAEETIDLDDASEEDAAQAEPDDNGQMARDILPSIEDEQSPAMARLMAETDSKMDEPESATRRNAFAHLRAAVAARKADSSMEADDARARQDSAYRSDLAEVVRPRRPVSSGAARTARPGEGRPAPLKLVAEQRVDVEQQRPTGPVRPRRVATNVPAEESAASGASFAEFASEQGATTLSELLEAAASYMSFVEGHEQFSRPQLMTKVRQVGPAEGFSREDGLRSFGQLLRAGKIEKIKGGRFTVSKDIGYRPDHRAAG